MREQGIGVTVSKDDGTQEEMELNGLLTHQKISTVIPAKVVFEMRSPLTEKSGPNLRNLLAHGMLNAASFQSAETIYAWWLMLMLCVESVARPRT